MTQETYELVNPARAGMIPYSPHRSARGGCKPRASGDDPASFDRIQLSAYVNPARAGMIRRSMRTKADTPCKPRASGDDPFSNSDGSDAKA